MNIHENAVPRSRINRDPLTGLPGPDLLAELLDMGILLAKQSRRELAVLSIEFDNFSQLVNELGQRAGDELLCQTVARMRACLDGSAILARQGTNGFIVVLQSIANNAEAGQIAAMLVEQLSGPFNLSGLSANTRTSAGVTLFPGDGADAATLLRNARLAMHQARTVARPAPGFFDPAMRRDFLIGRALESDLRQALEERQFVVHYQPVVCLPRRGLASVEALIRWNHPEHGLIGPEVFLQAAEDSLLIKPIGRWVIAEACRQMGAWRMQGLDVPVAVNVSARQLPDGIPPDWLRDTMERFGVLPRNLSFDFAERFLQAEDPNRGRWLEAMERMQIRIGLDDFGAGKMSLAQLKELNIRQIKIDRALVHAVRSDARTRAMVKSVVDIGRNMRIRVTAAGVEDASTLAALHAMGCDQVQGFHLAVPDVADRVAHFAATSAVPAGSPPPRRVPDPPTALAFV